MYIYLTSCFDILLIQHNSNVNMLLHILGILKRYLLLVSTWESSNYLTAQNIFQQRYVLKLGRIMSGKLRGGKEKG